MAASSSRGRPIDKHVTRIISDPNDFSNTLAITDNTMVSSDGNTCNMLEPLFRISGDTKRIFFDDIYVIEFLRRRRNDVNAARLSAYRSSQNKQEIDDLVKYNFEMPPEPMIDAFWKKYRSSDINFALMMTARSGIIMKNIKAIVLPCYLGESYGSDATKAHAVLFVIYPDKDVRQIWMYDSMINTDVPELVERYNYAEEIEPESKLLFSIESYFNPRAFAKSSSLKSTISNIDKVTVQKVFHLFESFAHCLEMTQIARKIYDTIEQIPNVKHQPSLYKFYKVGYGENVSQIGIECTNFACYGMYNLLTNWQLASKPFQMLLARADDIYHRPMITSETYIGALISFFMMKNFYATYKMIVRQNYTAKICTNSNLKPDVELTEKISKVIEHIFKTNADIYGIPFYVDNSDIEAMIVTDYSPDLAIVVYDRSFSSTDESFSSSQKIINDIVNMHECVVIVYPGKCIQFFVDKEKNRRQRFSEYKQSIPGITFALPSPAEEMHFSEPSSMCLKSCINIGIIERDVFTVAAPPEDAQLLIKCLNGGFVPFKLTD